MVTMAALVLVWPLLGGLTLFGGGSSDMLGAGYAFRLFGAQAFRETGEIPQWNPYLFGGMPYIGAMHGDIFYPTAWLRWIMPVDLAITWGMVLHFVLAGFFAWLFARGLGLSWTASLVAGVAYQLSGIVASQVSPGHDGKLFVSALAPLAFLALWHAIHDGRTAWFGGLALVVGLCILSPHYQMTYFLLVALGFWTLYLVFGDPGRSPKKPAWQSLALAASAVAIGIGIGAVQVLPFLEYIRHSPRAAGGPNTGWTYANLFAMPPEEIASAILPEFNGVLDHYWGRNPFKLHTEYLGAFPVLLSFLAWGDRTRRRLMLVLAGIATVFLLLAFAGHTPFYRPWYELMPMMKKLRAMGMVFYLVALPVALMAGVGLDRVLRGEATGVAIRIPALVLGGIAGLGVLGVLQVVAQAMAMEARMAEVLANGEALRLGSLRLLAVVGAGTGLLLSFPRLGSRGGVFAGLAVSLVVADLWSVNRRFFDFSPRAESIFRDDQVTAYLKAQPLPYRVFDFVRAPSYPSSVLMAYGIPSALGYHGNELRYYDELAGKDRGWDALQSPALLDLLGTGYLILPDTASIPGWHRVAGPAATAFGGQSVLYRRDTLPPYARVVAAAAKIPDSQAPATIADPRFPIRHLVLFADTASLDPAPLTRPLPVSAVSATVSAWQPGAMIVDLAGVDSTPSYLVISENWYPDWHADVDGVPASVLRADHAIIGVVIPPGSRQVSLEFDSAAYRRGMRISLASLLITLLLTTLGAQPAILRRMSHV